MIRHVAAKITAVFDHPGRPGRRRHYTGSDRPDGRKDSGTTPGTANEVRF